MMLIFDDGGWPMMANAWTIGWPTGVKETRISYFWGATGTPAAYMVTIPVDEETFTTFVEENVANNVCDLRSLQKTGPG